MRPHNRFWPVVAALCLLIVTAYSGSARGQISQVNSPVKGTGTGISGGIIAGAELVLVTEAIIDVRPVWAWWVFPVLGAVGGGIGGYYLEQASVGGSVALLVTSMALVIPTAVAVSVARAYDPLDDGAVDRGSPGRYSFEAPPPKGKAGAESEDGTTEVESRPGGLPDTGTEPLAPEGPPVSTPDGASSVEPAGEDGAMCEPPVHHRHFRVGRSRPQARSLSQQRIAYLHRQSLFHLDARRHLGMRVPAVDIRPVSIGSVHPGDGTREGVLIFLPLLNVELP